MAVSLELNQVTSVQDGPLYRVKNEVVAATNIGKEVFVFKTATKKFDHYATVADMESWPDNYDDALANGKTFYRVSVVQRDWETTIEMEADVSVTKSRLAGLVQQMNAVQGTVNSNTTTTISAG
jgi:hypothetical protein